MSRSTRPQRPPFWPLIIIGLGLVLVSVAILVSLNISQTPATSTVPPADIVEDTFPEVQRVSLADAKTAFDAKTAVFVDVRDADSYADGHIPGALSISLAELNERLDELNRSDWIITYCT